MRPHLDTLVRAARAGPVPRSAWTERRTTWLKAAALTLSMLGVGAESPGADIPSLVYSRYVGAHTGFGTAAAVDEEGNTFLAGRQDGDIFVTKVDLSGYVLFHKRFGGWLDDYPAALAIASNGSVYVAGSTQSPDFPTTPGALDRTCGSDGTCNTYTVCYRSCYSMQRSDAFVTQLDRSTGQILSSTFLGGSSEDSATALAADTTGVYVTGTTYGDFPLVGTPLRPDNARGNSFVAQLSASLDGLAYSTYFYDGYWGNLAPDGHGGLYIAGESGQSTPATHLHRRACEWSDVYVARIRPGIGAVAFLVCFGGSRGENVTGIAVDGMGRVWVGGSTDSADFPVTRPVQATNAGESDAFIAAVDGTGRSLVFSSYLGGSQRDSLTGLAGDAGDGILVTGVTESIDFPRVAPTHPACAPFAAGAARCNSDAFVAKINATHAALVFSTAIGGSSTDDARAVATGPSGLVVITGSADSLDFPTKGPTGTPREHFQNAFVTMWRAPDPDADGDTLPDFWEERFGLNPADATGANGPSGDPDGDVATNRDEFVATTHPTGRFTRYFAEGAVSDLFDTRFAFLNPNPPSAHALVRFSRGDGSALTRPLVIAPRSRATVDAEAGLYPDDFSTSIESDVEVVVDRTMTWDSRGYGSHAETSVAAAATTWYLAEGATHSGFDLFYLVQNPNAADVNLQVRYLRPTDDPIVKTYRAGANSRFNIWVDSDDPRLASTDVSAAITSDLPIVVERAMYLTARGTIFDAGHAGAGVAAPATEWFLAEGATGAFFDLFVLVANPTPDDARITATYLLPSGTTLERAYSVAGHSRFNIWVDLEDPLLADTAVSIAIRSTNGVPIVVERSMWWPGPTAATWAEAHNATGLTSTGRTFALAEGEVGGARGTETYLLIANRGSADSAVVTLFYEDGSTDSKRFSLAATSRTNVAVAGEFPAAIGKRFGALVEAASPDAQIVVERAMYWNANGVTWAAGTCAAATKLR